MTVTTSAGQPQPAVPNGHSLLTGPPAALPNTSSTHGVAGHMTMARDSLEALHQDGESLGPSFPEPISRRRRGGAFTFLHAVRRPARPAGKGRRLAAQARDRRCPRVPSRGTRLHVLLRCSSSSPPGLEGAGSRRGSRGVPVKPLLCKGIGVFRGRCSARGMVRLLVLALKLGARDALRRRGPSSTWRCPGPRRRSQTCRRRPDDESAGPRGRRGGPPRLPDTKARWPVRPGPPRAPDQVRNRDPVGQQLWPLFPHTNIFPGRAALPVEFHSGRVADSVKVVAEVSVIAVRAPMARQLLLRAVAGPWRWPGRRLRREGRWCRS